MRTICCYFLAALPLAAAFPEIAPPPASHKPPPPVYLAPPSAAKPTPTTIYEQQKLYGGTRPQLIQPQVAQQLLERFKAAYPTLASPRFLIYVNRELLYTKPGATSGQPSNPEPLPLADRQTMRDIERLFGRPLRAGGAALADQSVAVQLLGGASATNSGPSDMLLARQEVAKVADVVVEVLFASRKATVADFFGQREHQVPDIQATAIRLSDARILGQASSTDIVNDAAAANYTVQEITEAVALALMEDMLGSAKD